MIIAHECIALASLYLSMRGGASIHDRCSGTFAVDHEAVLAAVDVDAAMITEGGFHNVRDRCKLPLLLLTSK